MVDVAGDYWLAALGHLLQQAKTFSRLSEHHPSIPYHQKGRLQFLADQHGHAYVENEHECSRVIEDNRGNVYIIIPPPIITTNNERYQEFSEVTR